jgi:hypothetical protein
MDATLEQETIHDAELVRRCLAGNINAFAEVVARYQSTVCSIAWNAWVCGPELEHEDVFSIVHAIADESRILSHTAIAEVGENCIVECNGLRKIGDGAREVVEHVHSGEECVRRVHRIQLVAR